MNSGMEIGIAGVAIHAPQRSDTRSLEESIYAVTWALETIGLLCFWGLPGPALVGGAAMGLVLLAALRSRSF